MNCDVSSINIFIILIVIIIIITTIDFEQLNGHWDDNQFRDFCQCLTKSFLEKILFSEKIIEALLMENKEKVMDGYLFNLKFTVSKTGLKMLCCFYFYYFCTIPYTFMISTPFGTLRDLSHVVSRFLSPLSLFHGAIYH